MHKNASLIAFLAISLAACEANKTPTAITPTLHITSPGQNATVNVPGPLASPFIAVNFETNWTLKEPGQCGSTSNCGHVFVLVDSSTCNDGSKPYNALAISSPAQADLGKCPQVAGQHTVTLELRDDRSSMVKNPLGNPVTAQVTMVAQ
jgi:hypothetical protein